MVFVGDGVIAELPDGNITNQPTYQRHKIGLAGDSFEDILWRLDNGEMPARPAFIIQHAGQLEVASSGLTTAYDETTATTYGNALGAFYAEVKSRYPSSFIHSGIIPANSIGTDNTGVINTRIQAAIGNNSQTNIFMSTITDTNTLNLYLAGMTPGVSMSGQKSAIQLASNIQPGRARTGQWTLADDNRVVEGALSRIAERGRRQKRAEDAMGLALAQAQFDALVRANGKFAGRPYGA
jgi:hypothetical protein